MVLATLLRINAASCLGFGLGFMLFSTAIGAFLGAFPPLLIFWLGVVLVLNGLHLVWASLRHPPVIEVRYFSLGDFLWVALSLVLVVTGGWITTTGGVVVTLLVAAGVGTMGLLQWRMAGGQPTDRANPLKG